MSVRKEGEETRKISSKFKPSKEKEVFNGLEKVGIASFIGFIVGSFQKFTQLRISNPSGLERAGLSLIRILIFH